jgi:hypothetical protein
LAAAYWQQIIGSSLLAADNWQDLTQSMKLAGSNQLAYYYWQQPKYMQQFIKSSYG